MKILVINAGSSSLKYQLIDMDGEKVLAKGLCERIGIDGHLKHSPLIGDKPKFDEDVALPTHSEAIAAVIDKLTSKEYGVVASMSEINAVGHRVVHGGEYFASSVLITPEVISAIEACIPLAPLHNPANITGINACTAVMGNVPQVAVFDTAFHQTMPGKAYMYALPYEYYEKEKVRRYGFHGTSHRYVSERAAAMLGIPVDKFNCITCHMGNGSSFTAVKGGKSYDTSMGMTPLEGLVMGTRCGDIDAGIPSFMAANANLGFADIDQALNKKSGLLGISGVSSDMRDLHKAAGEGNARAKLAMDVLLHRALRYVGAYAITLGRVDAIVMTGGIGENDLIFRGALVERLGLLGIKLAADKNTQRGVECVISTPDSPIKVLVIPTNEELVIARDTRDIVSKKG